jgi:ABC-type branched-subunit amino acid transport system substrate-binding protein
MNRSKKLRKVYYVALAIIIGFMIGLGQTSTVAADMIMVGLNYPKTGPYAAEGLDQYRAAQMAAEEINAAGGILGNHVKIVWRDSQSKANVATQNVTELIDKEGAKMIFGGSSSDVAIAAGKVCQEKGVIFFGTLTYSTDTTGVEGHRHVFRECYDAWMGAKTIASYLKTHYGWKKYFYITADYSWGRTTEASLRKLSDTENTKAHLGVKTKFPGATEQDFNDALNLAKEARPDVLVFVLFGNDMISALRQATAMGLKKNMLFVVPNLTLGMAEGAGPEVMEGVIGAVPWTWKVPYKYDYPRGKKFVEDFAAKYKRYPSTSGASAYTILYEYKAAVERAKTFDTPAVIKILEGHPYTLLKDKQIWRDFDHQSVQTVYAVKCNPAPMIKRDKFKLDYFGIMDSIPGEQAVCTRDEWNAIRTEAGKPTSLERLPGE